MADSPSVDWERINYIRSRVRDSINGTPSGRAESVRVDGVTYTVGDLIRLTGKRDMLWPAGSIGVIYEVSYGAREPVSAQFALNGYARLGLRPGDFVHA